MHKVGRNRRLRKTHLGRSTLSASKRLGPETREWHSGQRHMKQPHKQAEHMAAPTNAEQKLQKILANGEPSTHGLALPFHSLAATLAASDGIKIKEDVHIFLQQRIERQHVQRAVRRYDQGLDPSEAIL